jgi:hypothetical protein
MHGQEDKVLGLLVHVRVDFWLQDGLVIEGDPANEAVVVLLLCSVFGSGSFVSKSGNWRRSKSKRAKLIVGGLSWRGVRVRCTPRNARSDTCSA